MTWALVGVGDDGPKFWECEDCGNAEVVKGTPMQFGEPMISVEAWKELGPKHAARYTEFRKANGLEPLKPKGEISVGATVKDPVLLSLELDFDGVPVDEQTRELLTPMTDKQLIALAETYNRRGREEASTVAFDICHRIHRFIYRRKADAISTNK